MLRLAVCLALAAIFGVSAAWRELRDHPPLDRLLSTPERWDGAEIRVASAVVRAAIPGFLVVEVDGLPLFVRGTLDVKPGDVVDLQGTFRARVRRLELGAGRKAPGWRWIPALVLAWAAWNLLRHFRVSR